MTIQRYHSWNSEDDEDGHYVAYDDYAELESAHKAALLTISQITDVVGTSDTLSISQQVAALAKSAGEHQAQGVDHGIETIMVHMNHQHFAVRKVIHILRTQAEQFRKEAGNGSN